MVSPEKDMSKSLPPESVHGSYLEVESLQMQSNQEVIRMGPNPITSILIRGNVDTEANMH